MTNLKYHLNDKHSKEYVQMISECEKRDNQIQQFFEFNKEIGKSKCITCGIFVQGNKLFPMKIHLIRHCKEKVDPRENELILLPEKPMELQNTTPPESSNLVQPKDSEVNMTNVFNFTCYNLYLLCFRLDIQDFEKMPCE